MNLLSLSLIMFVWPEELTLLSHCSDNHRVVLFLLLAHLRNQLLSVSKTMMRTNEFFLYSYSHFYLYNTGNQWFYDPDTSQCMEIPWQLYIYQYSLKYVKNYKKLWPYGKCIGCQFVFIWAIVVTIKFAFCSFYRVSRLVRFSLFKCFCEMI